MIELDEIDRLTAQKTHRRNEARASGDRCERTPAWDERLADDEPGV